MAKLTVQAIKGMSPREVINEFTAEEREAFNQLRSLVTSQRTEDIRWHYSTGKVLATTRTSLQSSGESKGLFYDRVAHAVGMDSAKTLYAMAEVADLWPTGVEFAEVADAAGPTGNKLYWSHIVALARVGNVEKRQNLITQCLELCWSAKTLQTKISENSRDTRGRKLGPQPQKNTSDNIENLRAMAAKMTTGLESTWFGERYAIDEAIAAIDDTKIGEPLIEQLDACADQLAKLLEAATNAHKRLIAASNLIADRLQKRDVALEAADDNYVTMASVAADSRKMKKAKKPKCKPAMV